MDQKQIEKLMAAMANFRITKVVYKKDDFEIEIERKEAIENTAGLPPFAHPSFAYPSVPPPSEARVPPSSFPAPSKGESTDALYVSSPMVGTFYAAPSPELLPFVKVGDTLSEDTVVCVVEAMKVMNEVKSGVKGVVGEILIKNGEPVEFGTHIIRVQVG